MSYQTPAESLRRLVRVFYSSYLDWPGWIRLGVAVPIASGLGHSMTAGLTYQHQVLSQMVEPMRALAEQLPKVGVVLAQLHQHGQHILWECGDYRQPDVGMGWLQQAGMAHVVVCWWRTFQQRNAKHGSIELDYRRHNSGQRLLTALSYLQR